MGGGQNWRVYEQGGLSRPCSVGEDDGRILLSNLCTSDFDAISAIPAGPAVRNQSARERARSYRSPFGPGVYAAEVTVTDAYGRRAEAAKRFLLLREDVDEGAPVARASVESGEPSPSPAARRGRPSGRN